MLAQIKNWSVKRKIAISILIVISVLYGFLMQVDFDLLVIYPYHRYDKFYWVLLLSIIFTLLFLLTIEKIQDFFSVFNFMWIFLMFSIIIGYTLKPYTIEKLDYLFAKEINNYQMEQYKDEYDWITYRFEFGNKDHIYHSINPSWEEIFSGNFKVYKSIFTNAYFLRKFE